MFIKSCNTPMFLHLPRFKYMVHLFLIKIILKGLNLMILTTFTCEKKSKSKQYKHFKRGTFKFDPLKCNNLQKVCIWIHNFQILHWGNHLLDFAHHKCHGKFKNKGFQTIFKITWKYKDFIKKTLWNSYMKPFWTWFLWNIYILQI
jgi:hypothetical protein